ncbi:MAG TPA: hypothetical protein VFJ51_06325 [Nitrososphaeraceae archaeon]|nr:hypothetical protein [Nitrososphaeraceae archaeon]
MSSLSLPPSPFSSIATGKEATATTLTPMTTTPSPSSTKSDEPISEDGTQSSQQQQHSFNYNHYSAPSNPSRS